MNEMSIIDFLTKLVRDGKIEYWERADMEDDKKFIIKFK
jgi:hypothetical protein